MKGFKESDKADTLSTCILGDSGFIIFGVSDKDSTKLKQIFRSKTQEHMPLLPYQCGTGCDSPSVALEEDISVQMDDIIVMSNGLFDNLF